MSAPTNLKEAKKALESAYNTYLFFSANKAQKRVMIAEDVLAQLKLKKFEAFAGRYATRPNADGCVACALGACFISIGGLSNADLGQPETSGGEGYSQRQIYDKLAPYFSVDQRALIESAFEREDFDPNSDEEEYKHYKIDRGHYYPEKDSDGCWVGNNKTAIGRAINFGRKFKTDRKRLEAIMQNIIDNGGTFKP